MIEHLRARSTSRAVAERLPVTPAAGLVLAVFERACLLVPRDSGGHPPGGPPAPPGDPLAAAGDPVALVVPEIGDGPLNVVVDAHAGAFAGLEPGEPATLARDHLRIGTVTIELPPARTWEPRPDWDTLRASWPQARRQLATVRSTALQVAPAGSLLALLDGDDPTWQAERMETMLTTRHAAWALAAGWAGDGQALVRGARHLAGLGSGLTPAGDDLLAGFMLRAWLAHPRPADVCYDVCTAAVPRTTTLAAAFLRAAARGECSAPWHTLLRALVVGERADIVETTGQVLAYGYTSGADTMAGFLWEARDVIMSKE